MAATAGTARKAGPSQDAVRRRYGMLLVVAVLSIAVQGMLPSSAAQQIVVALLAGVMLLLALLAAGMPRRRLRIAAALAGAVLVATIVRVATGAISDGASRAMNAALIGFGPPAVVIGVVRDLRTSGRVRMEAVTGVLVLYMLLGMSYGFIYGALDQIGSAPFFANGAPATVSNCLYFSFITLATVGYGDLVAQSDVGHTLAVFEALMGQIYLVTVVSLIVSNLGRPAGRRANADAQDAETERDD